MTTTESPRLLQGEFERLLAAVFTPEELAAMPAQERDERRMMFFSGARAVTKILDGACSDPDGPVTALELLVAGSVETELEEFIAEVMADAPTEGTA